MSSEFNNNDENYHPTYYSQESRFGKDGICRCGRPLDRPHCNACGSRSVNFVKRNGRTDYTVNGIRNVRGFACRSCGQVFQEDQPCAAPPAGKAGRPAGTTKAKADEKSVSKVARSLVEAIESDRRRKAADARFDAMLKKNISGVQGGISEEPIEEKPKGSFLDTSNDDIFGHKE